MGMSDQYDDGRYDPEFGRIHTGYDSGLALLHSNWDRANHPEGGIMLAGGWCIPVEQAPEPFTFPRIQRGGIKYPKPTKETHMPEPRMTKAQVANELRLNAELQETLRQRRMELQRQARQAIPSEPPSIFTMFTVSVRFKMRGKRYQFLILRLGGVYFTTGGKPEHSQFASWAKLCEWLEGPEVYDHSGIEILKGAGKVISFESGRIENEDTIGEPPF